MKDLKIIYMGTPGFAVNPLKKLIENGCNVVAVVTTPDKPAGRGYKLQSSAVKQYAESQGLKVLQPEKLKAPEFIEELKSLEADLQIVVAFRMLPEVVWRMPRLGTFNLHASLLPHYRGAAPINWAIINGEKRSGVTTFFINEDIDTGNILLRAETPIEENDTASTLHDRLSDIGSDLVVETVRHIALGDVHPIDQHTLIDDTTSIKQAPKITKETCRIDWNKSCKEIRNLVRGMSAYPGAWTEFLINNTAVYAKTLDVSIEAPNSHLTVGTVISDCKTYLKVACMDGWISFNNIQPAGKKLMNIDEFLRGLRPETTIELN